jgi:hypothetical protein
MERQPFVTSLTAAPSYRLGEPILITFKVKNTGSETYQLLTWGTPLEGELSADCFTVRRDGEAIPYDGKLVKRGDPPPEAYVVVQPGEQLVSSVDISDAYAIDQVGDYTVALNPSFFDAFVVPDNVRQAPRRRHAHEPHRLPSVQGGGRCETQAHDRTGGSQGVTATTKMIGVAVHNQKTTGGSEWNVSPL